MRLGNFLTAAVFMGISSFVSKICKYEQLQIHNHFTDGQFRQGDINHFTSAPNASADQTPAARAYFTANQQNTISELGEQLAEHTKSKALAETRFSNFDCLSKITACAAVYFVARGLFQ